MIKAIYAKLANRAIARKDMEAHAKWGKLWHTAAYQGKHGK